jgi:hypothetical protein
MECSARGPSVPGELAVIKFSGVSDLEPTEFVTELMVRSSTGPMKTISQI